MLSNKLAYALQADETADEKRRREKAQIEAADNALTNEMFAGNDRSESGGDSVVSSVVGSTLRKKQDHVNFAITVANKLSSSTPFNISAFYKEVTKRLKNQLSLEVLDEVVESLGSIRDGLKKKSNVNEGIKEKNKMSAKAQKQKQKAHDEKFGGNYYEEEEFGDEYAQLEEDYMF